MPNRKGYFDTLVKMRASGSEASAVREIYASTSQDNKQTAPTQHQQQHQPPTTNSTH